MNLLDLTILFKVGNPTNQVVHTIFEVSCLATMTIDAFSKRLVASLHILEDFVAVDAAIETSSLLIVSLELRSDGRQPKDIRNDLTLCSKAMIFANNLDPTTVP